MRASKGCLVLALFGIAICFALYCLTQVKHITKQAQRDLELVSAVFPIEQNALIQVVTKTFRDHTLSSDNKFSRFALAQPGEEAFPTDYQLKNYSRRDSMSRYLSIALSQRKLDFYLYDFSDADDAKNYWPSEYYYRGKPVPFRCNFIIHHEPDGPERTKVEIFEFAPRIWVGKKFAFERHGPGYYLDIREVGPTASDRVELLGLFQHALP